MAGEDAWISRKYNLMCIGKLESGLMRFRLVRGLGSTGETKKEFEAQDWDRAREIADGYIAEWEK